MSSSHNAAFYRQALDTIAQSNLEEVIDWEAFDKEAARVGLYRSREHMAQTGTRPLTIYLSGKMTGVSDYNRPLFAKYAAKYRALGYKVISPPELDIAIPGSECTWAKCIKRDIDLLLSGKIDRIYLLPDWEESKGARVEVALADGLGIPIYYAETGAERDDISKAAEIRPQTNSDFYARSGFMVKDSGARQEFAGGMVRDTVEGKPDISLVFNGPMLDRWAEHLTKGATKYPDVEPGVPNWTLAAGREELVRFRKSAARHFRQWFRGDTDEDHAAAVFFNINGAAYVQDKLDAKNS